MSVSVDQAFVKSYEREVKHAYQVKGSKLRNTVRSRNDVEGQTLTFQKIGKGAATTKARHGAVPPMNVDHNPVECTLVDYYAGDWVDKLDQDKLKNDERRVLADAGAYALGRKTDELIVTALDATTTTVTTAGALTKAKVLEAMETLGANDVFEEGRMYAIVGWKQWSDLLGISEFASADFVSQTDLPWIKGFTAKRWLGTVWMPHSGLTKVSNDRYCHWYHMDAVGHASGANAQADVTWHGDRAAFFINNIMSQGACLIDTTGVVRINADES